jgi:hypothetical protein
LRSDTRDNARMAEPNDRQTFALLLELTEDALLARLADEVALGVGPLDPARKRAIAKAWLDAQRDRLRDAVCGDPRVQAIRTGEAGDLVELAAAVSDLVASVTGKLPAATVAMLLVKQGLGQLCA